MLVGSWQKCNTLGSAYCSIISFLAWHGVVWCGWSLSLWHGLEQKKHILKNQMNRLKPTASRPPKPYGVLKIHKPEVPLRPIVSCIGSLTYQLAQHVTSLITPLTGRTSSCMKNCRQFAEMMRELKLLENEPMVNFDVKSLFTNVPVDEALKWCTKDWWKMTEQDYLLKKSLTCWSCVYRPPTSSSRNLIMNRRMELPWSPQCPQWWLTIA